MREVERWPIIGVTGKSLFNREFCGGFVDGEMDERYNALRNRVLFVCTFLVLYIPFEHNTHFDHSDLSDLSDLLKIISHKYSAFLVKKQEHTLDTRERSFREVKNHLSDDVTQEIFQ